MLQPLPEAGGARTVPRPRQSAARAACAARKVFCGWCATRRVAWQCVNASMGCRHAGRHCGVNSGAWRPHDGSISAWGHTGTLWDMPCSQKAATPANAAKANSAASAAAMSSGLTATLHQHGIISQQEPVKPIIMQQSSCAALRLTPRPAGLSTGAAPRGPLTPHRPPPACTASTSAGSKRDCELPNTARVHITHAIQMVQRGPGRRRYLLRGSAVAAAMPRPLLHQQ